ncbi:methyl sulfide methyltransferase-associated sensor [Geobacter sp. OR-1]|uniref:PAS domain S-box protein n=1 Tax=Geobacter sp. OR-1 TaxID=1266765 RepID=UPI00054438A7|nr:PAS domain S-box protein [Geobacter sp. OR-1]GAM08652.1 methyl sulfide methyltransferase-associated sensor [Geobacter sp. OR-1]
MKLPCRIIIMTVLAVAATAMFAAIFSLQQIYREAEIQSRLEMERCIKTFWEFLRQKGTPVRLADGKMYAGDYLINGNYELPDKIQQIFGGTATIFMGDIRVSTNVLKDNGTRAVGTRLVGDAYDAIFKNAKPYRGEATILGKPYFTAYDPIVNPEGKTIGVLYVGVKKDIFLAHYDELRRNVAGAMLAVVTICSILYFLIILSGRRTAAVQKRALDFLQELIDSMPNPVFYKDLDGRYLGCNKAFETYLGISRDALVGKTVYDVAPPEIADQYRVSDNKLFNSPPGTIQQYESRMMDADGAIRDVIFYKSRFSDRYGSEGLVGSILDITEKKHSETRERSRSEILEHIAKGRPLADILDVITMAVEREKQGALCSILLANKEGTRLFHGSAPSLPDEYIKAVNGTRIGKGIGSCGTSAFLLERVLVDDIDTHPYWRNFLPAREAGLRSCWSEPILSSTGKLLGTFAIYHREQRSPGPDEINLIESAAHFASIAIEQTETELALKQSERKYRELVENVNSIILRMDTNGRVTYFNEFAQRFFGYTGDELIGRYVVGTIVPDEDTAGQSLAEMINGICTNPEKYALNENDNIKKGGERVRISWANKASLDEHGTLREILCVGQDITERKRLQEMMVQTEKMMTVGGLAAGTAHELNNPLGAILQNAQNIIRRVSPGLHANEMAAADIGIEFLKVREYMDRRGIIEMIQHIDSSVNKAADIVANLLTFSQKSPSIAEMSTLSEIADKAISLAAADYTLKKKYNFPNIDIARDYAELPKVPANSQEIEQVIFNLMKNAAQAVADNYPDRTPRIVIRTRIQNRYALLEIEDNGSGIKGELIPRIFEPFFTTRGVGNGAGLGLSVAYSLVVNNHNGQISVETAPGEGSCFKVLLPLEREK